MANTIRIKRRSAGGQAGAPSSLASAEIAYNEADNTLYYGKGDSGSGVATSIISIAGEGSYVNLSGTQNNISGNKTFTGTTTFTGAVGLGSTATASTPSSSDNSTTVATTAFVKAQGYTSNAGTVTSVGISLPTSVFSNGTAVTSSGNLTATFVTQNANTVFAGPTSGSANIPSFRLLAADDIPTLTAAKISNFDTQVQLSRLDQFAAPTGSVSFNNQKITGLADPTSDQDAATKAYVDGKAQGLDVKESVRAATTANITLSGTQTIDGVSVIAGDRVLVKDQNTGSENGIYVVASGAWSRSTDANSSTKVTAGMFTFVEEGTNNADSGWVLTTNSSITLGTTSLSFTQFSGAGQLIAGNGLTKTGNQFDVGTASTSRIVVNADSIDLATTGISVGTYTSVTVDVYGRVTAGANPTTLAGYGITDAQPLDATLTALAGVSTSANSLIYATGSDTFVTTTLSAFGRSLIDDADNTAARGTLGLGTIATQNANNVSITGGSIDNLVIDGGTF